VKEKKQPEFTKWMGPILDCLREVGGEARPREVRDWIADKFKIPQEVREELTETGIVRFDNRVAWARQYLIWEGLLETTRRGRWVLSARGAKTYLTDEDARAIHKRLNVLHSKRGKEGKALVPELSVSAKATVASVPPDVVEEAELLGVLQGLSSDGFERVCQRLLRASGFEKVTVTGRSHDGGIDGIGILLVNPFVSFKVLFQCKRYKGSVSRAQVGDFRNAMLGRADKGIILTTGTFSADARKEAERDGAPPVELVDGEKLVTMFEEQCLGVKPKTVFEVDLEFFEQFKLRGDASKSASQAHPGGMRGD